MRFDLTNQAHREALRWACDVHQQDGVISTRGAAAIGPFAEAFATLSSAPSAALLLRAMLERLGVRVVEHGVNNGIMPFPYVSIDDGSRYDNGDDAPLYISMSLNSVPAKVIALLDIEPPNPERAIAVMKGNA